MSSELVPVPSRRDLTRAGFDRLPSAVLRAGDRASWRFIEFFIANIRNKNTRAAYAQAISQFFLWSERRGVFELGRTRPVIVSEYIEELQATHAPPTVKQHLAAIRMLFDWFVIGQVMEVNPASSGRGPKHVVKRGKTPVLAGRRSAISLGFDQDRFDCRTTRSFPNRPHVLHLRSRQCSRSLRVEDYYQNGKRCWIRLHEKGGKRHEVPAHHNAGHTSMPT